PFPASPWYAPRLLMAHVHASSFPAERTSCSATFTTVTRRRFPLENQTIPGEASDGHQIRSFAMKIYVGNMSFNTTQESLEGLFSNYGQVDEVAVITDRDTGRPRGFAFVTMANDNEAREAIEALNGQEMEGRTLT